MKKGLITVVGTILLAIAGRGYANAPTIQNVPDVVISDKEDNGVGATLDKNFFRYLNAFNILDYAKDTDTTPDKLLFAFKEQTNINNLWINGAYQLPNASALPSAWPAAAKIGTSGSYSFWFTFRDVLRSPNPDSPVPPAGYPQPKDASGNDVSSTTNAILPWSTTALNTLAGTSRSVTIFVGDEADNANSDTMTVYSVNSALDGSGPGDDLSGSFTPVLTDTTFLSGNWTWTQYAFTTYSACTSSGAGGAGYLGLSSGATAGAAKGNAFFARWITTDSTLLNCAVPFAEGNVIYCAKLKMQLLAAQSNVKAQAPDLRLGTENALQQINTMQLITAQTFGTANAPDTYNPQIPAIGAAAREYAVYWSQEQNARGYNLLADYVSGSTHYDLRRWRVFFDIADLDTGTALEDSGTWRLSSVVVGTLPRPADLASGDSNKFLITNLTSTNGWAQATGTNNVSIAQNTPGTGKITFNANAGTSGGTAGTVALWERPGTVEWKAGTLVRAVANLSCPTEANRSNFATARIRHATIGPWVSQVWTIRRSTELADLAVSAPLVPDTTANGGTNYEVYLPAYGGPTATLAAVGANYNKYTAAFDHVQQTGTDPATSWCVNQVQYEILADPLP